MESNSTCRDASQPAARRRGAQRKSQTVDIEDNRLHGGSVRYGWVVVLASIALALPNGAHAQRSSGGRVATMGSPVKRVAARAVLAEPPRLDGVLDDAAWQAAEPATDFVQMRPVPGAPSTRPTEARVVYDASAIYVGMRMYDHPDSVVSQLARRDASGVYTDWAHVLIDSYHDRRTAFRFSVTPRGTKKDVLHFDDSNEDLNWDAVWEVAVAIDSLGWTAEFRIPLSQLRFSRNDGGDLVWGINFGREIARNGESAWWSPVRPDVGGFVSHAGELYGLAGLGAARRLEVMPYAVAGLTRAPGDAGNPFYEANDPLGNVGVDLRYGITSNLTLSATINPDFGQVEADASVVNLTAYETFYPEKRPFFTEGSNFFEFKVGVDDGSGEGLFYSRRIGRAPQRSIGGGYVDRPDVTTILGAVKLSGKSSSGWTIGWLNAVTAEERARVAQADGSVVEAPVEPLTNYMVGSLARDFRRGESTVGMLFTATHRRLDGDDFDFLPTSAYAVGVRGRHRFAAGTWEASGYVAAGGGGGGGGGATCAATRRRSSVSSARRRATSTGPMRSTWSSTRRARRSRVPSPTSGYGRSAGTSAAGSAVTCVRRASRSTTSASRPRRTSPSSSPTCATTSSTRSGSSATSPSGSIPRSGGPRGASATGRRSATGRTPSSRTSGREVGGSACVRTC